MEKDFSLYLKKIGILEDNSSIPILGSSKKLDSKNFTNSTFYYLMNYFDNLTEQQKKYMSFYIPTKYKLNSEEMKKNKIKSIFIQNKLRQKLCILKHLYIWKRNISLNDTVLDKYYYLYVNNQKKNEIGKRKGYTNNNNNNNINLKKNINIDNILNIDNDIDKDDYRIEKIDNKNNFEDSDYGDINKINQIGQASLSLEDFLDKNNNDDAIIIENNNNKKKDFFSNKKKLSNYKAMNINSYFSKNRKKDLVKKNRNNNNKNYIKNFKYKYTENDNNYKSHPKNNSSNTNRKTKKKSYLYTSLEEKEMKELEECTFKPKINISHSHKEFKNGKKYSSISKKKEIQSTFDKLYHDGEKYKFIKDLKTIDFEYTLGKKIPFTPNASSNYNFRSSHSKSDRNFQERQNEYLYKKNNKYEALRDKINSDFEIKCSFNPKITNEKGEYFPIKKDGYFSIPVFQRLYSEFKERKNIKEQKEIENFKKFECLSNRQKKCVDYDVINKLYENKKDDIINKAREKFIKEKGITFSPKIEQNNYLKNISGTFLERNQKYINERKIFYEEENKKQIENLRNKIGNKDYTKEERITIVNNIINKLYKNQKNKNKNKNNNNSNITSSLNDLN